MIDCLLINPGDSEAIYQQLSTEYSSIEPPTWCGLLANALRSNSKTVEIFDVPAQSKLMLHAAIDDLRPRLIVICAYGSQPSASTQSMDGASKICKEIKAHNPDQLVLFVGGHVSALPEKTMLEEATDYAAKGEGLNTILGLLAIGAALVARRRRLKQGPRG